MFRVSCSALVIAAASTASAWAQPEFSTVPTQTVYQYQLNYQLPWQKWWGGPGWSLGGTMPTQGAAGFSTMNGFPLPGPLGAGVYVNGPPPHAVMPGPGIGPAFGPGPVTGMGAMGMGAIGPSPGMAMGLGGMPGFAAARPMGPPSNVIPGSFQVPAQPQAQSQVARRTPPVSPPGARRASLEQQNQGDARLRESQWTQAYVNYRNSIDLAPERPEPHFRIALTFTALKQYSSAVREFKKSIDLDPTLPQSGDTLSMIFNGDTKAWEAQVMPVVTAWTSEDLRDSDRLFLLGLLLSFNEDPRGSEMMEAARRNGPNDYIAAFLDGATASAAAPEHRRGRTHQRRDPAPQPQPDDSMQHVPPAPDPLVLPDNEQPPAPDFPPM